MGGWRPAGAAWRDSGRGGARRPRRPPRPPSVLALGLTLLCLPQVLYVYSYANSDAWGLSLSLALLGLALTQRRLLDSYPG